MIVPAIVLAPSRDGVAEERSSRSPPLGIPEVVLDEVHRGCANVLDSNAASAEVPDRHGPLMAQLALVGG